MAVARAILILIMSFFYYSTVAPVLTALFIMITIVSLMTDGTVKLLPVIVVWSWPVMLLLDTEGTLNSLGSVLKQEQEKSGTEQ